jgi:tRNA(fMet)-specific endonuclease VapC
LMHVLDTNTLIYFFKGLGRVAENLLARTPKEVAIPSIVVFELEVGIARSVSPQKRKQQLKEFTSVVQVLPFGYSEAVAAASIRVQLERQGQLIGPYDILIAAVALSNRGILITHNTREFKRIKGLQLEDWY